MNVKKISALMLVLVTVFSLVACRKDGAEEVHTQQPTESVNQTVAATESQTAESTTAAAEESTSETAGTDKLTENPEEWSLGQIVEFYKTAAVQTHRGVKSQHRIDFKSISVNDGGYQGLFDFIASVMSKLLANNTEDKDGITGGYRNLTEADVKSAKAYKSGDNTVVEMTMHEQVSGAAEDALSGSVGHAITAVGDISVVTRQITDLGIPLEIGNDNVKIYYTNPVVRVTVSPDGKIINGTWSYTVEIKLNDYKAFGQKVEKTSVVMDNILTLGGGFKK